MNLEVGMTLYCGLNRYKITRVTPKRAYIKVNDKCEYEFDREQDDPVFIKKRGVSYGYRTQYYSVETPELIAEYNRDRLISKANKINMNILTDDQLNRIMAIADEVTK
jgi:hypothetical protein